MSRSRSAPARSLPSPASRATARPSWPRRSPGCTTAPWLGGSIRLAGQDLTHATPRQALRAGIANIPEDRQVDGLVLSMSIADNLVLDVYNQAPNARFGARDLGRVRRDGELKLKEFDIRADSVEVPVGTLSGGNQQKVVVARELSRPVTLLVASQPTRGLDVGSIEYVHRRIIDERDRGAGVLLVSSELDEVLALGGPDRRHVPGPDRRVWSRTAHRVTRSAS